MDNVVAMNDLLRVKEGLFFVVVRELQVALQRRGGWFVDDGWWARI
jgi:hypothetical protein